MKQSEAAALISQYLPPDQAKQVLEALSNPKAIEQAVGSLDATVKALLHQKSELELTISELINVKATLTPLLPPDTRIEKLFG